MADIVLYDKQETSDDLAKYATVVSFILDNMKLDTNQLALDEKVLHMMSLTWTEHLRRNKVPISMLIPIYNLALDSRAIEGKKGFFSIEDMLGAWHKYNEGMVTKQEPSTMSRTCDKCTNGLIRVTQNGSIIEIACTHGE